MKAHMHLAAGTGTPTLVLRLLVAVLAAGGTATAAPPAEEIREDHQIIVAPPRLMPLDLAPGERFYNLPRDVNPRDPIYEPLFQKWHANYAEARRLRTGFENLDHYDRWFLAIPGAGRQIVPWMQDVYMEGMSPAVRAQFQARMQEKRRAATPAPLPIDPADQERRKLAALRINRIGDQSILYLAPGRIASVGEVFATTNGDTTFTWRIDGVAATGGLFTLVEAVTNRLEPEEEAPAAPGLPWIAAASAAALLAFAALGLYRARRKRPPVPPGDRR